MGAAASRTQIHNTIIGSGNRVSFTPRNSASSSVHAKGTLKATEGINPTSIYFEEVSFESKSLFKNYDCDDMLLAYNSLIAYALEEHHEEVELLPTTLDKLSYALKQGVVRAYGTEGAEAKSKMKEAHEIACILISLDIVNDDLSLNYSDDMYYALNGLATDGFLTKALSFVKDVGRKALSKVKGVVKATIAGSEVVNKVARTAASVLTALDDDDDAGMADQANELAENAKDMKQATLATNTQVQVDQKVPEGMQAKTQVATDINQTSSQHKARVSTDATTVNCESANKLLAITDGKDRPNIALIKGDEAGSKSDAMIAGHSDVPASTMLKIAGTVGKLQTESGSKLLEAKGAMLASTVSTSNATFLPSEKHVIAVAEKVVAGGHERKAIQHARLSGADVGVSLTKRDQTLKDGSLNVVSPYLLEETAESSMTSRGTVRERQHHMVEVARICDDFQILDASIVPLTAQDHPLGQVMSHPFKTELTDVCNRHRVEAGAANPLNSKKNTISYHFYPIDGAKDRIFIPMITSNIGYTINPSFKNSTIRTNFFMSLQVSVAAYLESSKPVTFAMIGMGKREDDTNCELAYLGVPNVPDDNKTVVTSRTTAFFNLRKSISEFTGSLETIISADLTENGDKKLDFVFALGVVALDPPLFKKSKPSERVIANNDMVVGVPGVAISTLVTGASWHLTSQQVEVQPEGLVDFFSVSGVMAKTALIEQIANIDAPLAVPNDPTVVWRKLCEPVLRYRALISKSFTKDKIPSAVANYAILLKKVGVEAATDVAVINHFNKMLFSLEDHMNYYPSNPYIAVTGVINRRLLFAGFLSVLRGTLLSAAGDVTTIGYNRAVIKGMSDILSRANYGS